MSADLLLCLQDTTDYVAYVAKDPINQRGDTSPQHLAALWRRDALGGEGWRRKSLMGNTRGVSGWFCCSDGSVGETLKPSTCLSPACHILECCEGLAQSVISTVGQAFELRFKQYLHSPPKVVVPPER